MDSSVSECALCVAEGRVMQKNYFSTKSEEHAAFLGYIELVCQGLCRGICPHMTVILSEKVGDQLLYVYLLTKYEDLKIQLQTYIAKYKQKRRTK